MAVVVVGSANVDLVVNSPRFPKPGETLIGSRFEQLFGGKGANQAAAAALLGSPVRVVMRVGSDDLGQATRKNFERLGIDAQRVADTKDAATGVALITVDAQGENTIVVASGANARLDPGDIDQTVFDGAAVVLTQLEVPVETNIAALRSAKARGVLTVFNAAPAPTTPLPEALWALCDVVCPNESELQLLTGMSVATDREAEAAATELLNKGVGAVLLTRGSRGCLLARKGEASIRVEVPAALQSAPVDTTGAGDAFLGALAHLIASGSTLEAALPGAVEVASTSVRRRGAQASYPTAADLGWTRRPPAPPSPTSYGDSRTPSATGALAAATEAVDQFVASGSVVGIGCGTTVDHCVQLIAARLASGSLKDVIAMATSDATEQRLRELGIPLLPQDSDWPVDVALTGCDGISPAKDVVKGGKGAMLREKLVRAAAARWVVVCDESKCVEGLGAAFPVPVEVAPAFHQRTARRLATLTGADARLRLGSAPAGRPGSAVTGQPFVTDNGNYCVDLFFRETLGDVWLMASQLDSCPGAVEHGLFPASMRADDPVVLVGRGDGGVVRM